MKITTPDAVSKIQSEVLQGNPVAVILVGVPGSGKSTFVQMLRDVKPLHVASTDELIEKWAKKRGLTYSKAWNECPMKDFNRLFLDTIEQAVLKNESLVIDRTNMSIKTRNAMLSKISSNFTKICLNFDVEEAVIRERVRIRGLETGKIISPMVLASMYKNYDIPTTSEGFDYIFQVDNNQHIPYF